MDFCAKFYLSFSVCLIFVFVIHIFLEKKTHLSLVFTIWKYVKNVFTAAKYQTLN